MKDVPGLFVFVLASLVGRSGALEPSSGYCTDTRCFTAFQDPSDFPAAQERCREQGGHLMTVRSAESHDVVHVLLGNLTGRFWIGLQLQSGCPDAAAQLRGFQWVTEDSESDLSNWAPSFDSSCSAPRCVSLSQEDDFKWSQEACHAHAAGFLCEYSFSNPCQGVKAAQGESILYRAPMGFRVQGASLPPGSIAVRMPNETKYVCFSEQWLQAPWSCEIQEGGCEHKCAVSPRNEPTCYCPPGQAVSPTNRVTCEAAIEDPCLDLGCTHGCYREGHSYACMCDHGFKLAQDGKSCVDFNDCRDDRQCPGDNFKCVNNVGGFQCVCEDGYKMTGGLCVDVDECMSAPCEHMCANTAGSYRCSCYDGYREDPAAPHKCKLHCGQQECAAECDPNDRYQCYCPDGYIAEERADHTVCIDMDECSFLYCDQDCENTFGGYVCACSPGYTLVEEFRCVKNEDDTDTDGGLEGSGAGTTPELPTASAVPFPEPDPTRRPAAVSVGGLVGILLCAVSCVALLVFLVHRIFNGENGKVKGPEGEAHSLKHVRSEE